MVTFAQIRTVLPQYITLHTTANSDERGRSCKYDRGLKTDYITWRARAPLAGCPCEDWVQTWCYGVPVADRAPRYLADHLIPASDAAPRRLRLRSANRNRVTVPRCQLSTHGCRAFYHAGLTVWNLLPDELTNSDGFDGFRRFLKTIRFNCY